MENLTNRQKQALETKQLIIKTFFNLLKDNALEDITIQTICKKANISVGAFYHHYNSKDEVLAETFTQFDDFVSQVLVNKPYQSSSEAIIDFLYHLVIGAKDNGVNTTREILKLALKNPSYFEDQERYSRKYLKQIVNKALEEKQLKPETNVDFLCSLLLRHARGIGYDWVAHNGNYDLDQTLHYDLTIILKSFENT
ncbi:TetR/AcrR family transcriptional regulator [Floccifex sp.]|uniref:TetR/AcrR family transcriptional regulator n=1 Tax=Floccifex sp. TaxID=2815810 RepID=UPI003F0A0D62